MPCKNIKYSSFINWSRLILFAGSFQILFFIVASAQDKNESGSFPIYNFSPKTYNALEQNFGIIQDQRGIMYFGNNEGVLEYDGVSWRLIRTRKDKPVMSLDIDSSGKVYIGSVNEFGFLEADSSGMIRFRPLSAKLDTAYQNFDVVWNTHTTERGIIFQTSDYLFIYNQDSIKIIASEAPILESFYVNDILYANIQSIGLAQLDGDSLVLLPGGEIFSDEFIYGIVDINPLNLLIATSSAGFYNLDLNLENNQKTIITKLITPIDDILERINIFKVTKITEDRIAFGTWGNGVILLDTTWNLISVIDINSGLQDQVIQGQYVDKSG